MTVLFPRRSVRSLAPLVAVLISLGAAGCGGKKDVVPTGITEADKFLHQKGTEALNKKRWYSAREYFQRLVDNYPQSQLRPDAKLGVGDAYLGEGTTESLTLAIAEFKEFLTFYPTHPRADYAQYKLGLCHFKQMRGPERDQTETRAAVEELTTFVEKYPNSSIMEEGRARLREARDRLSTAEYQVGYFYYRQRWYPGAVERLRSLAKDDPGFGRRDAVYFYLAESLSKLKLDAEALPYYDRIVKEFESSEFLEKAKQRLADYKPIVPPAGQQTARPDGTPPAVTPATPAPTTTTPASEAVVPTPAPAPAPPQG